MKYRAEIDGLRAIAVIPVILFHAGMSGFQGGFVGVDIFFVISGYLIASIILGDLSQSRFSFWRFYERRVRRIFPALCFMMLCCLPVAWLYFLPSEFKNFSQTLVSSVLFSSNILFTLQTGYFELAAKSKPLLHTWSLAVEEQYYLLFPLILYGLWNLNKKFIVSVIALLALISFVLAVWSSQHMQTVGFYMLSSRAWELLLGVGCALLEFKKGRYSNETLALLGGLLLLIAFAIVDSETRWPGYYTLLPTLGTALIISFSADTVFSRVLSYRLLVGIGLISYSAYLWHFPIIVFLNELFIRLPYHNVWVVAATFVMAWFSWKVIENPFRYQLSSKLSLSIIALVSAFLVIIGICGHLYKGFPWRFDESILQYDIIGNNSNRYREHCLLSDTDPLSTEPRDICYHKGIKPTVRLIGDSHANSLAKALEEEVLSRQFGYSVYTHHHCMTLPGFEHLGADKPERCANFMHSVLSRLADKDSIIVLSARWTINFYGTPFDNKEGGIEQDKGEVAVPRHMRKATSEVAGSKLLLDAIKKQLLEMLDDNKIVLIYPIPEAGWSVPKYVARQKLFGNADESISTDYALFQERNNELITMFDNIQHPNLYRVKPHTVFCDSFVKGRCVNAIGNTMFYKDDDHLSYAGASLLAAEIIKQIERAYQAMKASQ